MRAHPFAVAYLVALIPALAMALSQPVWSRVDEAQNFDFIVQLSAGNYPIADRSLIDPRTLAILQTTGGYRFDSPGTYPSPDLSDIGLPPPGMSTQANAVWMWRHMWQLSYESAQTPLFYVLMVPVYLAANALGGPFAAIYAIRLICVFLIAAAAPLAMRAARLIAPGREEIAWTAAVFAALLPGLDLNATRVSNDAPAIFLGGLLIVMMIGSAGRLWSPSRTALIGVALGVGLMTKLTLTGLVPALALTALWPARDSTWRSRAWRLGTALGIAAACLVPWFLINLHNYGALVMPASRVLRVAFGAPTTFDVRFLPVDLMFFLLSFWAGEPIGTFPFSVGFVVLGIMVALIALVGVVKLFLARLEPPTVIAVACLVSMSLGSLLLPISVHFEYTGPGRYVYPAIVAIAPLLALGVASAMPRAFANRTLMGMYGISAVAILVAGVVALSTPVAAVGVRTPPATARSVPAGVSGMFGGVSIDVDQVVFDDAGKAVWIHAAVANSGGQEAEWTVTPTITSGPLKVTADYTRSTQLPGDLEPGQSVSGWLYVPLDPATLPAGQALHIRFPDVAVDDYQAMADIDLTIPVRVSTA